MKRLVLLGLSLLLAAGMASAQTGTIDLFDDTDLTCNLSDAGASVSLHVWHTNITSGTTGSQFIITPDPGVTLLWFADQNPLSPGGLVIGASNTGVSLAYGACKTTDLHVLTVVYFTSPTKSPACSFLSVLPDPASISGQVQIVNCQNISNFIPSGGQAILNNDGSCSCNVPVQQSNWGQIKALYE